MRRIPFIAVLVFAILSFSCNDPFVPEPQPEPPTEPSPTEMRVIEADARFGLNVFGALTEDEGDDNVFISPLSLSLALGMTLNGARGETRQAMLETMQLHGLTEAQINDAYRRLIDMLEGLDPQVVFTIANSVWYRLGFPVEEDFLEKGRAYFDAEVEALDFRRSDAPDVINAWIERSTDGMIDRMIEEIADQVVMYLINAIYFKGDWTYQFDPEHTRDETFRTADGRNVSVPMMRQRTTLPYLENDLLQAVDLPYGDSLFTMTVLLPRGDQTVDDVIAGLTHETWHDLSDRFRSEEVQLYMPRFRLEYEKELNDVLKALGMEVAFDPDQADFTGINRDGELYTSMVKQKAVVDVNEEGTEAAAVTVVEVEVTSLPSYKIVRLDRPFVFSIRERNTGTILFIGKLADPS